MNFEELKLIPQLLKAVKAEGYEEPTPIQVKAIPHVLEGRDILGCAQTGTGKTAAFALPILQQICARRSTNGKRPIRALTLTPTRELAAQIGESFEAYARNTDIRVAVVFGGVSQRPQTVALEHGIDILVATPGRLLDLAYQGLIDFYALEIFVLDEADRMLDMGFIKDVKQIVSLLPEKRQTLFFSATMPPEITGLAEDILRDPVWVSVAPPSTTIDLTEQSVYFVERQDKPRLLAHLFKNPDFRRVLIFTRTKHGADKVARHLSRCRVNTMAIHGNKSQSARENALDAFKQDRIRALVATDIASRGIDVSNVTHVINYDLPDEPENYVHRIGRTGRAGVEGIAVALCDSSERDYLADIERLIRKHIRHETDNPYKSPLPPPPPTDLEKRAQQGQRSRTGNTPGKTYGRNGGGRNRSRERRGFGNRKAGPAPFKNQNR